LKQRTITILGFGNVGRFICSQLLPYSGADLTINLIDKDEGVAGAILDLKHGKEFFPQHRIYSNHAQLFYESDIIFHCAGASVPKGQSRTVSCEASIGISESIFQEYQLKDSAFMIVVANPVEVIAHICRQITGLPVNQVIGVGTFLDSIRMNYCISQLKNDAGQINAHILGEHGSTAFMSESLSTVGKKSIVELFGDDQISNLEAKMRSAAGEIKLTQAATIYGVAYCAMQIFYALMGDIELKVAASTAIPTFLKKELGKESIYLSLFSKIDKDGIHPFNHTYTTGEIKKLKQSLDLVVSCIPKKYLNFE